MTVALENVHIAPQNELSRQLLDPSLEDLLEKQNTSQSCDSPPLENEDTNVESNCDFLDTGDADINTEELRPFGHVNTMPTTSFMCENTPVGNPELDIGKTTVSSPDDSNTIKSDEQRELDKLFEMLGGKQLTRKKLECAPSWLLDKAVEEELEKTWKGAYILVPNSEVSL